MCGARAPCFQARVVPRRAVESSRVLLTLLHIARLRKATNPPSNAAAVSVTEERIGQGEVVVLADPIVRLLGEFCRGCESVGR